MMRGAPVVFLLLMAASWAHAQDSPAVASGQTASSAANSAAPAPHTPASGPAATSGNAAQGNATQQPAKQAATASKANAITTGEPVQASAVRVQRKAAKLYLAGVRLLEKQQPEAAWDLLKQAAALEPGNSIYVRAAELARQSAVTQLVQQASRDHGRQDSAKQAVGSADDSASLLRHALEIDPQSPAVLTHLDQLADEAGSSPVGVTAASVQEAQAPSMAGDLASSIRLEPTADKHTFHLLTTSRQLAMEVFRAYGIDATIHDSVQGKQVRLDVDDATFAQAVHVLALVTGTFYEALDSHRVVVARDTRANRTELQRQEVETIYLPGMTDKNLKDVTTLAHNVFDVDKVVDEPTRGTMTIRAPARTIDAFNRTVGQLENGTNQLDLNVKVIQLSHIAARETGTTFFQSTGVYNAYSEISSIIQQNQSAVQQIITSGLVPNASTLTNEIEIVGILLAAGQLSGTPFNQGFLVFGGGLTSSILSPSPATLTFSLNSSDTRTLDDLHMRLSDDEAGTFKIGERYPIETSSYSSVALPAISGISSAAVTAAAQSQTVPQIQYEDLGLTLKATPKILRSNDVAMSVELKIESLGGTALNDIPILNSQQFVGALTMREGETAVLVSDLSRQESRALSGLPGISDIPGLQDVSDIARNQNVARLLILITPSVVRGPKQLAHGPMLMVDKGAGAH
jgi:general secretion pathway protein D